MPILVLHTYGILEHPIDHPATQAFFAAVPDVQASRDDASGLLRGDTASFMPDGTPRREVSEFGPPITPEFFDPSKDRIALATLSAWTDPESAAGYSYHGTYGSAFKRRTEWFSQDHSWPSSVLWWTDDVGSIGWELANSKLAYLHKNGPSPEAFTFRSLYSDDGEQIRMNNERVKEIGKRAK